MTTAQIALAFSRLERRLVASHYGDSLEMPIRQTCEVCKGIEQAKCPFYIEALRMRVGELLRQELERIALGQGL